MFIQIMKYRLLFFLSVSVLALSLWQCARRGSPTGGEKDTTPPVLLLATPENETTGFQGKKIRLVFDEYVVTKDLRKQLIISPPMNSFPDIHPSYASKKLDITIIDTLKPNTTYVLNFGNSIQDFNENNPLADFKYVFSTGSSIDTLWYEGDVADAFMPTAERSVTLMLYPYDEQYSDSLVYKGKPMYVTNTLDSLSSFTFEYLKEGKYKLVALKDKDNNYLFNPREEKIAFLTEPISVHDLKGKTQGIYPKLRLFREKLPYKAQRPTQASLNRISFGFEGGTQSVTIRQIAPTTPDFAFTVTKEPNKDTLNLWYSPKQKDSLVFTIAHEQKIDTFRVRLREGKDMKADSLRIEAAFGNELPLNKPFTFKSNIPLTKIDSTRIKVTKSKDSSAVAVPFNTKRDSERLTYSLLFSKKHDESYAIEALPGAFTDFFGATNDTLKMKVQTKKEDEVATFKLNLTASPDMQYPIILQLTDEKATEVIEELFIEKAQTQYLFSNLAPSKYRLRLIEDRNSNGKWDTGDFLQQRQPERVWYFGAVLELRANWEVEEQWEIKKE